MNNYIIECDVCERELVPEQLKEITVGKFIYQYFECQNCNQHYLTCVLDDIAKKSIEKYQSLYKQARTISFQFRKNNITNPVKSKKIITEYDKLIKEIEKVKNENVNRQQKLLKDHKESFEKAVKKI